MNRSSKSSIDIDPLPIIPIKATVAFSLEASFGTFLPVYFPMRSGGIKKEAQRPLFRTTFLDYPKLSAQMLRAHPQAYTPSRVVGAGDSPPDPGTVLNVFSAAIY